MGVVLIDGAAGAARQSAAELPCATERLVEFGAVTGGFGVREVAERVVRVAFTP
ncbi:hypothetical protein [Yinghuangia seranimata]|uniref:hypothetical protein n=1 Tax=Yinghuangia seranimata TaxID=408067 RepID=UPI003CCF06A7